jgi:hypothetical protein
MTDDQKETEYREEAERLAQLTRDEQGYPMTDEQKETGYREEAERLAQLTRDEQRRIVAMIRSDASNPKVPERDRAENRARARALERLLRLAGNWVYDGASGRWAYTGPRPG